MACGITYKGKYIYPCCKKAYARTGDLEAAAALLTDLAGAGDDEMGSQAPPPEKERKRMAVIVSCVALVISILAVAMVGVTLGLSHMMDAEVGGHDISGEFVTSKHSVTFSFALEIG